MYRIDPWGERRADYRSAQVCCTIANAMRAKGPAYRLDQFLLDFGDGAPRQRPSVEQMRQTMLAFTITAGGEVRGGAKRNG